MVPGQEQCVHGCEEGFAVAASRPLWAAFGIVDLAVASRRPDRRTLTDVVAGTVLLTQSVMTAEGDDEGRR